MLHRECLTGSDKTRRAPYWPQAETLEPRLLLSGAVPAAISRPAAISPTNTIVVNTTNDPSTWSTTDQRVSLREALAKAAASTGDDLIKFDSSLFASGSARIVLKGDSRDLVVDSGVVIQGPGPKKLIIDGAGDSGRVGRIFQVNAGVSAEIRGLTLTGGNALVVQGDSGPIAGSGIGGAVVNFGSLILKNVVVTANKANLAGGGIDNEGLLSVSGATISSNRSDSQGGGIFNNGQLTLAQSFVSENSSFSRGAGISSSGSMSVAGSTFTDNVVDTVAGGGAIANDGTASIRESTFTGNHSGKGGAIFNLGTIFVANSTMSGNTAGKAAGIDNFATATVIGCTLNDNHADEGAGAIRNTPGATLFLINSTVAGNTVGIGGGGLDNSGTATVRNCTIVGNSGDRGGGINGGAILCNTIVAGNFASTGPDVYGSFDSASTCNLIGILDSSVSGMVAGKNGIRSGTAARPLDPRVGSLANNGGPTQTMSLLAGSRAINAGSNAMALDDIGAALTTDQRGVGFARISGKCVDIGAFELKQG